MRAERTCLRDINLVDVEHELRDDGLYIDLIFNRYNPSGSTDEITIKSIKMCQAKVVNVEITDYGIGSSRDVHINGKLIGNTQYATSIKQIKTPDVKELSVEEIENLLGYPVKIVNKKEDEEWKN